MFITISMYNCRSPNVSTHYGVAANMQRRRVAPIGFDDCAGDGGHEDP